MRAAVEAAAGSDLVLLAVTVLTSMDEKDVLDAGYQYDPRTLVLRRAKQALQAGMGGIVCSAEEAAAVRGIVGPDLAIVTPGIRPAGAERGDQKRVVTPAAAIRDGASHLVVGRPIVGAVLLRRRIAPTGFILLLGGLTYPLYLLHQHIGYAVFARFATAQNRWAVAALLVCGLLALSCVIAAAIGAQGPPRDPDARRTAEVA